ncbi:MAG TPA: exodeoxyribonuclease VII large subunit [Deltaproteobacteria bacterium]|nr:exodeoxyribonuclease VII large subunit [Deltaproteobacteria bacterium]
MTQLPEELFTEVKAFSLSELNRAIKEALEITFPDTIWVVAEISEIRIHSKGHCYFELVEKKDDLVIAQIKANIWAYSYKGISNKFEKATGETLKKGMQVLLSVNVTFHEVYGISLNIKDIDPTYSLGEMARKKKETIEKLTKEGYIYLNKQIPLPLVPQRIAVISSETAAGLGDFINHLDNNPYGYRIFHKLYQSLMQGLDAEASIISSLQAIKKEIRLYDAVVIIRGGGSQTDLSCFDTYNLAVEVAKMPIPVITGIGHERDDTLVDLVAHTKLKTPTAAAEFLISGLRVFEERLLDAQRGLIQQVREILLDETNRFNHIIKDFRYSITERFSNEGNKLEMSMHKLIHAVTQAIDSNRSKIIISFNKMQSALKSFIQTQNSRVKNIEQAIELLNPVNVLKRGYSITLRGGRVTKDISGIRTGDILQTKIYKGTITSKVEGLNEE